MFLYLLTAGLYQLRSYLHFSYDHNVPSIPFEVLQHIIDLGTCSGVFVVLKISC